MLTEKETLLFINEIEKKYSVDEWTVNGFHVWPLIRLQLGHQFIFKDELKNKSNKRTLCGGIIKRVLNQFFNHFKLYIGDFMNNSRYNGEEVIVVLNNADRNIQLKDRRWYNPIIDPICDSLHNACKKTYCLEYIANSDTVRIPRYSKSNVINLKLIYYIIKEKLQLSKKYDIKLSGYDDFVEYCHSFGISIEISDVLKMVKRLNAEKEYYIHFLKHAKVSLILLSNWSNAVEMGLTIAAKQLGIKCMDINHGFYSLESFYNFGWIKEPERSYECRPDYYWCWTAKSAIKMNRELKKGKAIYGGSPYILAWFNDLNNKLDNNIAHLKTMIPDGKKIVLFTLNHVINRESYPEWLFDVVKETEKSYFWLFRKHRSFFGGGQDKVCMEVEQLANVEWKESTRLPLLQLLEISDVHVTYNSSTLIEAEAMGVKTIIFSELGKDRYADQIASGHASCVDNKEDMIRRLDEYSNTPKNVKNENGMHDLLELLDG